MKNILIFYIFSVSIATFIVIAILVMSEVAYYATTELKFDYEVDTKMDGFVFSEFQSCICIFVFIKFCNECM